MSHSSIVVDAIQAEIGAIERWPDDVCLYQPYQAEQIILPDYANCLSVRTFLKMCNLPYSWELRTNAEEMSPSGRVPFLKVGAFIVAEFDPIVAFINTRGFQLQQDLSDGEKAELRAYIAMVENTLVNAELYLSWLVTPVATEVTRPRYGSVHPWPLNWILPLLKQRDVKTKLKSIEWANKSLEQVEEEVRSCCQALSERLGNKKYFFRDSPSELDALIFGHLFSILTTNLPEVRFAEIIQEFHNLTEFCKNIDEKYYRENDEE